MGGGKKMDRIEEVLRVLWLLPKKLRLGCCLVSAGRSRVQYSAKADGGSRSGAKRGARGDSDRYDSGRDREDPGDYGVVWPWRCG